MPVTDFQASVQRAVSGRQREDFVGTPRYRGRSLQRQETEGGRTSAPPLARLAQARHALKPGFHHPQNGASISYVVGFFIYSLIRLLDKDLLSIHGVPGRVFWALGKLPWVS